MSGAPATARSRRLSIALFLAYPVLVHGGIVLGMPLLPWLALQALYAGVLLGALRARRPGAWIGFAAFAVATFFLMRGNGGIYALYVPPLALMGLAFTGFARTLVAGREPLITQIAEAARGPLSPALRLHTRRVTQIWAATLALMLAITLALTVAGPRELWSLFANVLSYLIMGALFVGEYAYRRWRFPEHDRDGFAAYLRIVIAAGPRMRGRE